MDSFVTQLIKSKYLLLLYYSSFDGLNENSFFKNLFNSK